MINSTLRYQKGLTLGRIFPSIPGFCACGCGQALFGRKAKWASESCRTNAYIQFAVLKGDKVTFKTSNNTSNILQQNSHILNPRY